MNEAFEGFETVSSKYEATVMQQITGTVHCKIKTLDSNAIGFSF